jgi:hypothetical protein
LSFNNISLSISELVDNAPESLNTLREIATSLGNNANLSSTLLNEISTKVNITNPTFFGTVTGITKDMVGLNNIDNTSDIDKPISLAVQNALNNKAPNNYATSNSVLITDENKNPLSSNITKTELECLTGLTTNLTVLLNNKAPIIYSTSNSVLITNENNNPISSLIKTVELESLSGIVDNVQSQLNTKQLI